MIGASDSATIMGVNPWKSRNRLWKEKLGLEQPEPINQAMQRGIDLESTALEQFCKESEISMGPIVKFHKEHSFMMASMDGMDAKQSCAVEIKCNGEKNHELARKGIVPEYYLCQIQHQMAVCGLDWMYYYSYRNGEGIVISVDRNEAMIENMIVEEKKFWDCMQNLELPDPEEDFTPMISDEWLQAANEIKECRYLLKKLQQDEERLKDKLCTMAEGRNARGCGVQVTKCYRKGAVDYQKIPELLNVDIERYRKPMMSYLKISEVNQC
jgi:putative phage-type endonuclease